MKRPQPVDHRQRRVQRARVGPAAAAVEVAQGAAVADAVVQAADVAGRVADAAGLVVDVAGRVVAVTAIGGRGAATDEAMAAGKAASFSRT